MTVTRDHDAWRAVVQRLGDEPEQLTTDELARLADAHWWLSDIPASIRVDEILHRRLVAEGRPRTASVPGVGYSRRHHPRRGLAEHRSAPAA
jgi:hypothetical protein